MKTISVRPFCNPNQFSYALNLESGFYHQFNYYTVSNKNNVCIIFFLIGQLKRLANEEIITLLIKIIAVMMRAFA